MLVYVCVREREGRHNNRTKRRERRQMGPSNNGPRRGPPHESADRTKDSEVFALHSLHSFTFMETLAIPKCKPCLVCCRSAHLCLLNIKRMRTGKSLRFSVLFLFLFLLPF